MVELYSKESTGLDFYFAMVFFWRQSPASTTSRAMCIPVILFKRGYLYHKAPFMSTPWHRFGKRSSRSRHRKLLQFNVKPTAIQWAVERNPCTKNKGQLVFAIVKALWWNNKQRSHTLSLWWWCNMTPYEEHFLFWQGKGILCVRSCWPNSCWLWMLPFLSQQIKTLE